MYNYLRQQEWIYIYPERSHQQVYILLLTNWHMMRPNNAYLEIYLQDEFE